MDLVLRKMSEMTFYGIHINLFDNIKSEKDLYIIGILRNFIQYHFSYFLASGNINCDTNKVI